MLFPVSDFLDSFSGPGSAEPENFFNHKRKAWHDRNKAEARCDLALNRHSLFSRGVMAIALWKRSTYGRTLSEIKDDPEMIPVFADNVAALLKKIFSGSLSGGDWAIVTPPPRRHKEGNFAQAVARIIADILGIPFHKDVATARSRQRVDATFDLVELPPEHNIIVFDDIYTTGSTLKAMQRLLAPLGKNLINIVAINNG